MSIRVLVVDDSAIVRAMIERTLSAEPDIEVVATAANASEARSLIKQHDPDVITLDIEMPGMDGLSFLEKIMSLRPTPVIIVSGSTQAGTSTAARALQIGAVNCYDKSRANLSVSGDNGGELAQLVREAASVDARSLRPNASAVGRTNTVSAPPKSRPSVDPDVIAIGSSTGGVEALHTLLADFPEDCPPTLIVQHIRESFAPAIVQSLSKISKPDVVVAQTDMILRPGVVTLAPGGARHLILRGGSSMGYRSVLREGEPVSGHRPSVDRLFQSVTKAAGERAIGVLLTGMGEDGAAGLLALAQAGAHTIAQDEASCVVFGMPRAAIAAGAAREVLPLTSIAKALFAHRRVTA